MILQKMTLIIAPLFIFKTCLSKYNTEKHLYVTYKHREAALKQFQIFEKSINDEDKEAKNNLRLDIAKTILSDSQTGYIKDNSDDLNINPAIFMVERVFR